MVGRQLADCDDLAKRRGWTVVERYVDADLSAWKGKQRPEYARLVEEIEAGLIDALVVYHADRLKHVPEDSRVREPAQAGKASS